MVLIRMKRTSERDEGKKVIAENILSLQSVQLEQEQTEASWTESSACGCQDLGDNRL